MSDATTVRLETIASLLARDEKAARGKHDLDVRSREPVKAGETGSPLEEAKFVESVAVIAAVGIAWIAKRIVDDWLKSHEQGVQIDLRKDPAYVSVVANVPRGFVVIIAKDGTATTKEATYEKAEDLRGWLELALKGQ